MDTLKDPAMITALVVGAGSVGSTVYLNRRINATDEQLEGLSRSVHQIGQGMEKIGGNNSPIFTAINDMGAKMKAQTKKTVALVNNITDLEEQLQDQQELIEKLVELLAAEGKDVKSLVPDRRRKKPKSILKKPKVQIDEDEDEDDEDDEEETRKELEKARRGRR